MRRDKRSSTSPVTYSGHQPKISVSIGLQNATQPKIDTPVLMICMYVAVYVERMFPTTAVMASMRIPMTSDCRPTAIVCFIFRFCTSVCVHACMRVYVTMYVCVWCSQKRRNREKAIREWLDQQALESYTSTRLLCPPTQPQPS